MFTYKRNGIYYVEYFDTKLDKIRRVSTRSKTEKGAGSFLSELNNPSGQISQELSISLLSFKKEYGQFAKARFSQKYQINIDLSFRKFIEYVGNPRISSISHRAAENFLLSVFQEKKYSAHMYNRTLKAAFNKAIKWELLNKNPFAKISLPKIETQIPVFITATELEKILELTSNYRLRILYKVAFYTGMRLGEIANLKWKSVNLMNKTILVSIDEEYVTKNRKERMIPISNQIYSELLALSKTKTCEYVFASDRNYKYDTSYISHRFKKNIRKLGFTDKLKFHSLRHSFASNLVQNGASIYIVKELLGHESINTTQIYSHLDNKSLFQAVDLL